MNIVFAYPTGLNPQKGGVERITDIIAKILLKRGYTIFYLNWEREQDNYEYPVPVIDLPSSNLEDPNNLEVYNRFLKENRIDVIINQHGLYEGTYFLSQVKVQNVKIISVLHSDPFGYYDHLFADLMTLRDSSIKEKVKRVARFFLYRKVKKIIHRSLVNHYTFIQEHPQYVCLLSESYKERLEEYCDLPDNYFISIPNPNTYENIEIIPHKEPILLFVGRLDNRSKKLFTLIDIWYRLCKLYPQWKLIIVGDGPDKDVLINKAKDISNIEFKGYQDPREYYEKASIFCMTSIFEGFPMCLTEAMQFGCVPIAFDSFSAVYDIIKPGETGELVKSFDKKEYVGKLIHLIDDETYRKKLSKNAFQYVKRYDIANILPKWIELIEK
ncbi:glycosyltransferase [Barnesiella intestinihominis]|uniref:glycosyltransferase n=1 Tax=Barnesiella intestinihominis TaxID=487174 RepID=UPI0039A3BD82